MHLVSKQGQSVTIEGKGFEFTAGESIHTENSYKYSIESFRDLASSSGFRPIQVWTDTEEKFSVQMFACR